MELEALIDAFHKQTSVILLNINGYAVPLHFKRITAIIPEFDKHGNPDYTAQVVDSVGRPYTVRAKDLEVG